MRDPSLTLLGWIWAAHWRAHPGRSLVAVLAIAVGVALGLGVDLVNRSALGEFESALAIINGESHAQVRGVSSGFDEAVIPASPLTRHRFSQHHRDAGAGRPAMTSLQVVAIDRACRAVTPICCRAGRGAQNLGADRTVRRGCGVLSPAAMSALNAPGDVLTQRTGGAYRCGSPACPRGAGQRLAVMDSTAQWRLGWMGRLSRIDVRAAAASSDHARREPRCRRVCGEASDVAADVNCRARTG
jgi:putative ABC transport system permease protein